MINLVLGSAERMFERMDAPSGTPIVRTLEVLTELVGRTVSQMCDMGMTTKGCAQGY